MNLKDRGNKKWVSLMLVEHKRKLKKLKEKTEEKEKPELEEDKLQEMNYILKKAIKQNLNIKIQYYKNKNYYNYRGIPKKVIDNKIEFKNKRNNIITLLLKNIIDIDIIEKDT